MGGRMRWRKKKEMDKERWTGRRRGVGVQGVVGDLLPKNPPNNHPTHHAQLHILTITQNIPRFTLNHMSVCSTRLVPSIPSTLSLWQRAPTAQSHSHWKGCGNAVGCGER